jgi:hypothetical protein
MSLLNSKELITRIILQDLKHNQLIKGLRDLGFDDSGVYSLDLLSIVAGIQEIPEESLSEQWVAIYQNLMDKATSLPVSALGTELRELAEEGYALLEACRRVEAAVGLEKI